MASLKVYVGEKLAEEFDLDQISGTEFVENQRILESTGNKLREEPPRRDISIFSINTDDGQWYAFYDYDGLTIRQYSPSIMKARHDKKDLELFFPVEHNPRYKDQA